MVLWPWCGWRLAGARWVMLLVASVSLNALGVGAANAGTPEEARARAALRCQRAVASAAEHFTASRDRDAAKCVGDLVDCVMGRVGAAGCAIRARATCARGYQNQATLAASLRTRVRKGCDPEVLLAADAVGFEGVAGACGGATGVALDALDTAIACMEDEHICAGARALVTSAPRTAELLRVAATSSSLPVGTSCLPDHGSVGGAVVDAVQGRQAARCVTTMLRAGARDRRAWRGALGKCVGALFSCAQRGAGAEECQARAAVTCDEAFRQFPAVDPASVVVEKACGEDEAPFASLADARGANAGALVSACRAVEIGALGVAADWRACVARTAVCQVAETMAYVYPRADELLARVGRSLQPAFCPQALPIRIPTPSPSRMPTPVPTATPAEICDRDSAAYGLTTRPSNATCRLDGSPDQFPSLQVERAFPALTFARPVQLTHAPDGSDRVFVVEQAGTIRVFANGDSTSTSKVFLDLSGVAHCCGEEGLLGLAFHPEYAANGYFYVYYSAPNPRRSVIARYHVSGNPNLADATSGKILLEIPQPYDNHNGGQLAFGPDGMLYVALGDGGLGGDPQNRAQDLGTVLGKILRLDVDHADSGLAYAVPPDNPFVGVNGARGEIWALGLRNPWRMSFDRLTHALWAGDVGEGSREEIDLIERGRNYGWRRMEGNACYDPSLACSDGTLALPVASYGHSEGCAVMGGFVYRGTRLPELYGAYVYGDYCSGKLWTLRWDGTNATVQPLATSGLNISSFGEDRDGELYILDVTGGTIHRLRRRQGVAPGNFPLTLSATGCFDDLATRHPAPGVLAYDVQSPLWSDGAGKRRFLALPDGATIGHRTTGSWDLPVGTILVKEFTLERERGNPASAYALETRFLVRRTSGWEGYTYQWNEAQTEAYLLDGATTATVAVSDPQQPGVPLFHTHYFPSRSDCGRCHAVAAGGTLGLQTGQLNRVQDYDGVSDNQLRAWEHIGLFGACLPARPPALPRLVDPADLGAPLDARARSYLHSNCAHCHRPGGTAPTAIDLRVETAFAATGLCEARPQAGDFGVAGARLVRPGHAEESVLWLRAAMRGGGQMPPVATLAADPLGTTVLGDWITALGPCP